MPARVNPFVGIASHVVARLRVVTQPGSLPLVVPRSSRQRGVAIEIELREIVHLLLRLDGQLGAPLA